MDEANLTADALKDALIYKPETGNFIWRTRHGKRGVPGRIAGTVDVGGYWVVTINGKRHKGHRLAHLYMTGKWPESCMDHINGIRTDNRWANLRPACPSENQHNRKRSANNKSGFVGVSWDSGAGKWRAGIRAGGRSMNLGGFDTKEDAAMAYLAAKAVHHPFNPVPRGA